MTINWSFVRKKHFFHVDYTIQFFEFSLWQLARNIIFLFDILTDCLRSVLSLEYFSLAFLSWCYSPYLEISTDLFTRHSIAYKIFSLFYSASTFTWKNNIPCDLNYKNSPDSWNLPTHPYSFTLSLFLSLVLEPQSTKATIIV